MSNKINSVSNQFHPIKINSFIKCDEYLTHSVILQESMLLPVALHGNLVLVH